jgi:plasmid stabilization system protein ParE
VTDFLLRPAAVADLRQAYQWYQSERPGLGEEFLQAVHASVERALATPAGYAVIHRDTRRVLIRRFPYGLFFRIVNETVVFVACYHLHRKPASWKRRR